MQKPYDWLAKGVIEGALDGPCEVHAQEEVVADAKAIDAWVVPDPKRVGELASRGLLGRMARESCAIEAFHNAPGLDEADDALLKVIALHQRQRAAWAAKKGEPRGEAPVRPRLWIVSAGDPVSLREGWALVPMAGWPTGCFATTSRLTPSLVVVSQLPRTRDTLLLRCMGSVRALRLVREDLQTLPLDAWEREMLRPIMQHLRIEMPRMGLGDYDQGEDAMRYREAAAIWKQEEEAMRAAARREGVQEGRQEASLATITLLFERRLKRSLSASEGEVLHARLSTHGVASVSDLLFDLDATALEAWLRADEAE